MAKTKVAKAQKVAKAPKTPKVAKVPKVPKVPKAAKIPSYKLSQKAAGYSLAAANAAMRECKIKN